MSHEIGELFEQPVEMRGLWRIPDFLSLLQGNRKIYFSPKFLFWDCIWQWRLCSQINDWMQLHLFKLSDHSPLIEKNVYFSVSIRNASGKEEKRVESNTFSIAAWWDTNRFLRISDVQNRRTELAPSGVLTISYTLRSPSEGVSQETQTEDGDVENDERHSKDMEKLREKFRLWLQQPQEGRCIRILRREHFQKRPEGDPSSP